MHGARRMALAAVAVLGACSGEAQVRAARGGAPVPVPRARHRAWPSGGRLQVTMDSHTPQPSERMPQPRAVVNVVATLPGTHALSKERLLVVSGHYDSRASDVMDASITAPGANDDASGVAAVMEMACVLAGQQFDATLVFIAVAGEEQGLLGPSIGPSRRGCKSGAWKQ